MICFFHSSDFDGICSGAIVKHRYPQVELIPLDYGDNYDDKIFSRKFTDKTIFFVDVTLQPPHLMLQLEKDGNKIIIIDHHVTAIDNIRGLGWSPAGVLDTSKAGCQLTWEFLYPDRPMPVSVEYLGQYDVWNHSNPHVVPFQYGMRYLDMKIDSPEWNNLFDEDNGPFVAEAIALGGVVQHWNYIKNKKTASMSAREMVFEGLMAVVVNGYDGSPLFDSVYNPEHHDIMISYIQRSNGIWQYGLYSDKPDVHCGEIAEKYGGGGHPGASGFSARKLIL